MPKTSNSLVTDSGLKQLQTLIFLEELNLRDTAVTKDGAEALRKALPLCNILH